MRAKGGEESLKGMQYPSLRTDSTHDSAPIACANRQPPTCKRGATPSGGLLPGTLSLATGVAGAAGGRRKRHLAFVSPPLPTLLGRRRGGGRRRLRLRLRHHGRGAATVSRGNGRGPCLDRPRRRLLRNLRWMQGPLNKSIVQSRTHLGQGRV